MYRVKLCVLFYLLSFKALYSSEVEWNTLRKLKIIRKLGVVKEVQTPKVVENILNKNIHIEGFMLPLDFSKKEINEFLLVPYIPSCSHIPPPPSNQVLHVKMKKGKKIRPTYYPIKVRGELSVLKSKHQDMDSMYAMDGQSVRQLN